MIEYIKGIIDELTPATATIECNGIGYLLNISLNTYSAIQGKKDVKLYVYETIREDAYILNGFASKKERELFLLLITVPGIGSSTARMILSALTPSELCEIVSTGNDKLLKGVKGIGLKTAQRIIVDLKDKIATISDGFVATSGTGAAVQTAANKEVFNEAISALTALGFQASASQKVVSTILKNTPEATVENVIKMALKML